MLFIKMDSCFRRNDKIAIARVRQCCNRLNERDVDGRRVSLCVCQCLWEVLHLFRAAVLLGEQVQLEGLEDYQ